MHHDIHFDDKDKTLDCLFTQKFIVQQYQNSAMEAASEDLRRTFMEILNEEHANHKALWNALHEHGHYKVQPASADQISQVQQKFEHFADK